MMRIQEDNLGEIGPSSLDGIGSSNLGRTRSNGKGGVELARNARRNNLYPKV